MLIAYATAEAAEQCKRFPLARTYEHLSMIICTLRSKKLIVPHRCIRPSFLLLISPLLFPEVSGDT